LTRIVDATTTKKTGNTIISPTNTITKNIVCQRMSTTTITGRNNGKESESVSLYLKDHKDHEDQKEKEDQRDQEDQKEKEVV